MASKFYRIKPKIVQTENMTLFPNDEYEQVKLSCPLRPDHFGDCEKWHDGEGSQECIGCPMASWEVVGE